MQFKEVQSMLYFLVDSYTGEIMDTASTQRLCNEKYDALVSDSGGLFIWAVIRAQSRKEAEKIIVERDAAPY
jgi:hypothetical protein